LKTIIFNCNALYLYVPPAYAIHI